MTVRNPAAASRLADIEGCGGAEVTTEADVTAAIERFRSVFGDYMAAIGETANEWATAMVDDLIDETSGRALHRIEKARYG